MTDATDPVRFGDPFDPDDPGKSARDLLVSAVSDTVDDPKTIAYIQGAIELREGIALALTDQGIAPEHHRRILHKHRREWPALWRAIDAVLGPRS